MYLKKCKWVREEKNKCFIDLKCTSVFKKKSKWVSEEKNKCLIDLKPSVFKKM